MLKSFLIYQSLLAKQFGKMQKKYGLVPINGNRSLLEINKDLQKKLSWVFLKPLPPGDHTIFYNVRVTPTGLLTSPGTNPHFADITYSLHVRK
jgi:hypothetical protein